MPRESIVATHVKKRVAMLGGETRRVQWIGRNGAPDLRLLLGDFGCWWCETKGTDGEVTGNQQREHNNMRGLGELVIVLDSIAAVDRWFDQLERKTRG